MSLQIKNLTTYHGRIKAIDRVNLHINEGEIVSIIGANGAGKSTLLGTIAGIYKASEGEITIGNQSITNIKGHKVVQNGVALVPEGRQIFSSLSVKENLILGMYAKYRKEKHLVASKIESMLKMFPGLVKHMNNTAGNMSGGEQQMLAIARALMSDPKIILLDEPSMGLAPLIVKEILAIMEEIRANLGAMVILVEQNVKAALSVADRAYVMDRGQFVLEGSADELLRNPQVQSTYLGYGQDEKGLVEV
ncbi:ABC transporter ATP-binding protein [Cytobacillus depressus]|uniref:ABC transporter ATP-binding protein n=1 Tax=Cytobacillus depressus TaxID=1602942 RepID=A0A6L3V5E1_9BACI|nr:ABC transporter ATP-binding protein [Cytobacillus depressus]KAB2330454.1 ABC transporter ATP-binding protein [Cytobacillus depressus]